MVKLRFQIQDTGGGISKEQIHTIFQPFTQVGDRVRQSEGTGLGLAICWRIVNLMGSQMQVTSELGQGSTFSFEIEAPVSSDWKKQKVTGGERTIVGYVGDRKTILIVDDSWDNRSVLANFLAPLGFELLEAENGQEGLSKAASCPNLIITDLVMPVMDGLEMLRQLRASQALQHIKVVVSSASVAVSDRQTSIDAGGDAFLPKPVQIEELLQILQSQLNLTWQYTDAISPKPEIAPEALIDDISLIPDQIPDVVHLQALLTLVQLGLLKKFIEEAQRIEQMNPDYHPFILKTIQLAKNFQIESLEQLLEKHIS